MYMLDGELYRMVSGLIYRQVGRRSRSEHAPRELVKLRRLVGIIFLEFDLCFRRL